MEAQVALKAAFSPSVLLGLVDLIFLLTIPYRVQISPVGWPIKHSNTMGSKPVTSRFGTVGRCQVLPEKEISISIKLVSRQKHEVLQNLLVEGCIDSGLVKHSGPTVADDMAPQITQDRFGVGLTLGCVSRNHQD